MVIDLGVRRCRTARWHQCVSRRVSTCVLEDVVRQFLEAHLSCSELKAAVVTSMPKCRGANGMWKGFSRTGNRFLWFVFFFGWKSVRF